MLFARINALAVDFGVLPKHPDLASIRKFLESKLQLDIVNLVSVQIHTTRGIAYVGLPENLSAAAIADRHHLQHEMPHGGKIYRIPVVIANDDAVDVRVHDLPPEIPNDAIAAELRQYGEVLAVTEELWKFHFPGVKSGVRIARMIVSHPIPKHIAIYDTNFIAHIRHPGQTKKCSETAAARRNNKPAGPPAPAPASEAAPSPVPATAAGTKAVNLLPPAAAKQPLQERRQEDACDQVKQIETKQPKKTQPLEATAPQTSKTTPGEEDFIVVRKRNKNRRQQSESSESTEPADKFFAGHQSSDSELDDEILRQMTFEEVRKNYPGINTWKWCKIHHNIKA